MIVSSFYELLQLAGVFALFTFIVHLYQSWLLRQMRKEWSEAHTVIAQSLGEGQKAMAEAQKFVSQNIT